MSLIPGTRIGSYEIAASIGAGGMGEVYRATDSHLKRSVALKVLPTAMASDADRLARFQREAEVLAALNHPNIAAIHGLEKTPDFTALVMELVEGEDLSQSGAEDLVLEGPTTKIVQDWSRDGRYLLYYEVNAKTGRDLRAIEMTGTDRKARVVADTPFEETLAQLSPDGRWVAYQTSESGRFEIVVQPFPDAGGKWQVSTGGGVAPRWRADGKEIYFLAPDATMMAATVTAAGPTFQAGTPVALFQTRILGGGAVSTNRPQYAVARDGRFLINQPVKEAAATPITLVINWRPPANP